MNKESPPGAAVIALDDVGEGMPRGFDLRCARLALAWTSIAPLCCARGAFVDGRHRDLIRTLLGAESLDDEPPVLRYDAPSGVVIRLADRGPAGFACSALADLSLGVLGEGCRLRGASTEAGLREDGYLLDGCALFPLALVGGDLVPSPRIPDGALTRCPRLEASLWGLARGRVGQRFGERLLDSVENAVRLLGLGAGRLHLRTLH